MKELDVSNNLLLNQMDCSQNQLNSLNISNNTRIGDSTHNRYESHLNVSQMPSLEEICVWEIPFPTGDITIDLSDSSNAFFTADCN